MVFDKGSNRIQLVNEQVAGDNQDQMENKRIIDIKEKLPMWKIEINECFPEEYRQLLKLFRNQGHGNDYSACPCKEIMAMSNRGNKEEDGYLILDVLEYLLYSVIKSFGTSNRHEKQKESVVGVKGVQFTVNVEHQPELYQLEPDNSISGEKTPEPTTAPGIRMLLSGHQNTVKGRATV
ncbi:hypothetical protein AX774_g3595 [Zancudomyces culisetae]|uniref:Uncharacterized protein n=1 Tax=Zancudomyces culisetae TaxID=1213189 RepID=A0A1R1PBY1_ZANCU|nr:hypothetical protein AX774_g8165 [Zancudomyces culisetae]OMH82918.1 hypothetical protein AX774_g3595 [Zancudomyces culisetae]|eukprot:OMH78451.1 hypothetical protein AX774_g8165 [Zancudomyces culisetae]